jgi:hypothetical protein
MLNIPPAQDEFPYIHIAWGHLGTDLVVIDTAGRVSIFTTIYALARMSPARGVLVDHEDEMGAVVGMHWLSLIPHQQKVGPSTVTKPTRLTVFRTTFHGLPNAMVQLGTFMFQAIPSSTPIIRWRARRAS